MANVTTTNTSCPATVLSGPLPVPVPFKDFVVVGNGDDDAGQHDAEMEAMVSALPSNTKLFLRRYQGTWVLEPWVPGIVAIQRGGLAPRHGDVVLASAPKCGTTWLKALAFATMARAAHPSSAGGGEHPLLRANPHDCVPFMEKLFAAGLGRKVMDALPSPRIMATHMHHSILPASIADNPHCKIVYAACEGSCLSGPIWDHVLGYWNASKASPERVLFLRYEEMLRDPVGNVPFSPAEEEAGVAMDVVRLCSFDNLKDLKVNKEASDLGSSSPLGGVRESAFVNSSYFRRGQAGDWVNHMTPEMAQRLDAAMEERLRGSGFSFSG
nr:unnamed protein product [Digitaria exilis]